MHKIKIVGWELPKAQIGKLTGDPDQPYHPITNPQGYKGTPPVKQAGPTAEAANLMKNRIALNRAKNQQQGPQFNVYDESKSRQGKRIHDEEMRLQAQAASDLSQTMGSFTPQQYADYTSIGGAGSIGANTQLAATAIPVLAGGVSIAAPAVAAGLEAPLLGNIGTQYGTAALTGNNLINSYFAYEATKHLPDVSDAWKNVYNNPSVDNAANVAAQTLGTGLAYLPMGASIAKGMPSVLQDMSQTGNWLTTQTPLKNTYKINPWAEKLRNPNYSYRVAGLDALEDFQNTGVLRSNPPYIPMDLSKGIIGSRTTSFPSFQKGYADLRYLPEEGGVIFETQLPTYKRGQFNPVTGNQIKGRHYAHRVIDPNTGYALSEIPASDIKAYSGTPDWLRGFQEVPTPKSLSSSVGNIAQPWTMQELPGLHLSSTMSNGPISKIVEPKTGLINVDQALAIIGKESGGKEKADLVRKALGETIPKKMDFNHFRKIVQNELIPLEKQFSIKRSEYGIDNLGYMPKVQGNFFDRLGAALRTPVADVFKNQDLLENKTLILSNKNKFGRGSASHGNPKETLGHIHYLVTKENPDILTITQIQADALQGTNRTMPKTLEEAVSKLKKTQDEVDDVETLMGNARQEFKRVFDNSYNHLTLDKATVENFTQKSLLDKNHQERYIQELVNYAAERGGINKLRFPTPHTAAKVQNYSLEASPYNTHVTNALSSNSFDEFMKLNREYFDGNFSENQINSYYKTIYNTVKADPNAAIYKIYKQSPEAVTILKKYENYAKLVKKLYGIEPKVVTDAKGNSWYEFEIPESFKQGKGEIKAFKEGGAIISTEGYKQGPPPPGSHYRIPSNTLYNPTPYRIKAVANTGETKILPPFDRQTVMFPGASHVDEYPMMQQGGLTKYQSKGRVTLPPIYTDDPRKVKAFDDSTHNHLKGIEDKKSYLKFIDRPYGTRNNTAYDPKYIQETTVNGITKGSLLPSYSITNLNGAPPTIVVGKDADSYKEKQGGYDVGAFRDPDLRKKIEKGYTIQPNPVQPYILQPEPTLNKQVTHINPISASSTMSTPGLRTMQQPNIELPAVQRGKYRTSYYDPEMKDWNERAFMTQQESDQFADEMSKRGYPGPYGNITQRVQYKFGGSELKNGGWMEDYDFLRKTRRPINTATNPKKLYKKYENAATKGGWLNKYKQ